MTYDSWKSTEPDYVVGFICDGCHKACDPHTMVLRDDGPCYCLRCDERFRAMDEE